MNKILELRSMIKTFLQSKHPNVTIDGKSVSRVFYEAADDGAPIPYIVFELTNSTDDGSMENFVLDIDGWDMRVVTTELETLMDDIDGDGNIHKPSGLHRLTLIQPGQLAATFYRENRFPLHDDDPRIRRRKIIYQVRTFVPNH